MRNLLIISLLFFSAWAKAQGIKGVITNEKGEVLPYVTIYCVDSKTGTNSNMKGIYELKLSKGQHQVNFQSIDYQTVSKLVEVGEEWNDLQIVMKEQTYQLNEVKINGGKDNPANYIMRKAIAAAPYYRRQVLKYKARVYVKGTGRLDKAPRIFRGLIKDQGIEIGRSYVTESINELQFSQPSTYREKVISVKSSIPFEGAPEPMRMARGSWYDIGDGEIVSPLSPQAFSVYDFILEGSFYENGREINKIRIKPKRKGNDLYAGTLYIIEDLWCLHSCVLTREESDMTVTIKTSYKSMPEYPYVWMPVTYDIAAAGGFMGVTGSFRYLASLGNYQLMLNPNVDHNWVKKVIAPPKIEEKNVVQTEKKEIKKTKNQEQIEELLAKEKLSKSEMLKLASKIKKESEKETQNLQLQNDSSELIIDSLAYTRDSSFWNTNRPVPLLKEEQQSFVRKDTSQINISDTSAKKKHIPISVFGILISGDRLYNKSKTFYFSYKGLLGRPYLNTVEGFGLQTEFTFGNTKPNWWSYKQVLRIPLERPTFQTRGELSYFYNPAHLGLFKLEGGTFLQDFNPKGISTYVDAFQLLVYQTNYSKFYQQEFASISMQRELVNGLLLQMNLFGANRFSLQNIQRYQDKEGKDGISSNTPFGNTCMPTYQTFQYTLGVSYKPFQQFKIRKNVKQYLKNEWPSISAQYKEGRDQSLQFNKVDFGLTQNVHIRHWLILNYQINAGFFPNAKRISFPDAQHFAGNQSFIYDSKPTYRFQQLPYYDFSSTQSYQSLFMELEFKKLLIRQLPYFNLLDFKEDLYFNYLHTAEHPLYFETGYRLNQIFDRVSLGVNFHFISNQYKGAGFLMTFQLKN